MTKKKVQKKSKSGFPKKKLKSLGDMLINEIGEDVNGAIFYVTEQTIDITEIFCLADGKKCQYPYGKSAYGFIPPKMHKEIPKADLLCLEDKADTLLESSRVKDANHRFNAMENKSYIRRLSENIEVKFILLGLALHINRERKYWKELGYISLRAFMVDNISSQSRAYRSIEIAETFCLEYGINNQQLARIGEKKLAKLIPVIRNKPIDEVREWLNIAEILSFVELKAKVDSEKDGDIYIRPPTKSEIIYEIRRLIIIRKIDLPQDSGEAIMQIGRLTGYNHNEIRKLLDIRTKYAKLQEIVLSGYDAYKAFQGIQSQKCIGRKLLKYQKTRGMFIMGISGDCDFTAFDSRDGDLLKEYFPLTIDGIEDMYQFFLKEEKK